MKQQDDFHPISKPTLKNRSLFMPMFTRVPQALLLALLPLGMAMAGTSTPLSKVNRTSPRVSPPAEYPVFSSFTTAEIRQARVFSEPLLPIGGEPSRTENLDMAMALLAFAHRSANEERGALQGFLSKYPASPWRASLLFNMGALYYHTGYLSRALEAWEEAWNLSKWETGTAAHDLADHALGQLAKMNARLGRFDRLEALFREIQGRDIHGPATELITGAREGLWLMKNRPEDAFRCGPMALGRMLAAANPKMALPSDILHSRSSRQGLSLGEVKALSEKLGMDLRMAKRVPGAPTLFPAVAHWKVGHFGALMGHRNGLYLVKDPTFGGDLWMSQDALDAEASGYFLVRQGALPAGWTAVGEAEAESVWGKGNTSGDDPDGTGAGDGKDGGASGSDGGCPPAPVPGHGMPVYSFHTMLVSLNLVDVPVGITPPRGPSVLFRATYNQREAGQPANFSYSNLGPKWTFDWLSYITDDPANAHADVALFEQGGGTERYKGYDSATSTYTTLSKSQAVLVRISSSPIVYERRLPDGSKERYTVANGAATFPRKVFLTRITDPRGDTVHYTYDAALRLVSVTDALGQVTTLTYGLPGDTLKITRVTDPFGRYADFEYNGSGRLKKITDVLGLASEFTYGSNDVIATLTTPYGITTFSAGDNGPGRMRWVQATDPLGQKERLEFRQNAPGIPVWTDPIGVPGGMTSNLLHLQEPSTYFWDKKAMATSPGVYSKAVMRHWLRSVDINSTSNLLSNIKYPLENRIWYNYPDHNGTTIFDGIMYKPSKIGRILDDGSSQIHAYEYNSLGQVTKYTDPLGRITAYTYAANNVDLVAVRQKRGVVSELQDTLTYNGQHLPLTLKDAAGQTTTFTYNAQGQILTLTNARGETTTHTYDSLGYLLRTAGPGADTTRFTYDTFGRVKTVTYHDGFTVAKEYDAFDRLTKVKYPDSTYEQFVYNKFDLEKQRDRRGRWTKTFYNANRRAVAVQDAAGRVTNLDWCSCGALSTLTDPSGRITTWHRDIQGRVTEKEYANGRKTQYAYEPATGRLKAVTDAKGQITNYEYFKDDDLKQVSYTNASISTPTVSYAYDSVYNRLASLTDGQGTTGYGYFPVTGSSILGASRLKSIDGPLANDSILFTYDSLGRVSSQSIDGTAMSFAYDSLGRTVSETNALGAFTYKYVEPTGRLDSLLYPNGQKTKFSYYSASSDFRLQEIKNLNPAFALLSRFGYTYDAEGQIKTWNQQTDSSTASTHSFAYDEVDQLLADVVKSDGSGYPIIKHFAYTYDKSGNRLSAQEDSVVNGFNYNSLNQLVSQQAGGKLRFKGSLNEAGTVTVNGQSVPVSAANEFDGMTSVVTTTDTTTLVARDYSNNSRTSKYRVNTSGAAQSFTYDDNGNMIGDGTRTFEWDAQDRLVAVVSGSLRSEFGYDGLGRRVQITEKSSGAVTSKKMLLWLGNTIVEERDSTGGVVAKRFFEQGMQIGAAKYYYTRDHLGSIREMADTTGAVVARYEYDPYGTRTKVSGSLDADFGFTGHYLHASSGFYFSKYRAYSPILGRWISRDPLEEVARQAFSRHHVIPPELVELEYQDEEYDALVERLMPSLLGEELNLYGYVSNDPMNSVDLLGLEKEHSSNKSKSNKPTHQKGQARKAADKARKAARKAGQWGKKFKGWKGFPPVIMIDPCILHPELCGGQPMGCPAGPI